MDTRRIYSLGTTLFLFGMLMLNGSMLRTVQAETPTPTGRITVTGQIIPDLNTDVDERLRLIEAGEPLNTFKFYIYDVNGVEYELNFDDTLLASLGSKFIEKHRLYYSNSFYELKQPKYLGSSVIWQEWAGDWATITGNLTSTKLIQVQSMQKAKATSTAVTSNFASTRRASRVTYTGILQSAVGAMPVESDGINLYTLKDDKTKTLKRAFFLFASPKSLTRVIGANDIDVNVAEAEGQECIITGWIFTQLKLSWPDIIFLQSIQLR